MVIDLTPLLDGRVNELPVDEEVPMKRFLRNGDELQFDQPVSLRGKMYRIEEDVVFFSGDLEVSFTTACSRCLDPVKVEEAYDFDEVVYAPGKEEDYDLIMEPEGQEIDLESFTENILDLKLPLRFLCDEECKGLCPVCGANLNTSECNCNEEKIDPRFAMLKNLLKDSNS